MGAGCEQKGIAELGYEQLTVMSAERALQCSTPTQFIPSFNHPQKLVYEVTQNGQLLGIIISAQFRERGIHFFTPDSFSQQLAYMRHPAGKVIPPHVHNPVPREVSYTQEVLIIKRGKLRVDFYSEAQEYLESYILLAGDVILLATGGHGFEMLEEVEMVEVKQGPYVGEQDKTRF
jgi:mannose-6-phosphate isomerase-like protein (cupin superfamily)